MKTLDLYHCIADWYGDGWTPNDESCNWKSSEWNRRLWSVMMTSRTPKRANQLIMSSRASAEAVMSMGKASGQRVYLSTMVRRYLYLLDGGREPTRSSMWTCERSDGMKYVVEVDVCLCILARWHGPQCRVQRVILWFMSSQQYGDWMRLGVVVNNRVAATRTMLFSP